MICVLVAIGGDGRNLHRQTGWGRVQLGQIDRRAGGEDAAEEYPAAELWWWFVGSMAYDT